MGKKYRIEMIGTDPHDVEGEELTPEELEVTKANLQQIIESIFIFKIESCTITEVGEPDILAMDFMGEIMAHSEKTTEVEE